jgi:hypothetical protein
MLNTALLYRSLKSALVMAFIAGPRVVVVSPISQEQSCGRYRESSEEA